MGLPGGLQIVTAGALAYLLGSISPAYILGKRLGPFPAIITAAIDLGKGIAAVLIAERLLQLPAVWLAVPAWAVVLGHIFPFYLRFRGGAALAVAVGVYLLFWARTASGGSFARAQLAAVLAVTALVLAASRNGDLTALVAFFFLGIVTLLELGLGPPGPLMFSLSLYCFALSLRGTVVRRCSFWTRRSK